MDSIEERWYTFELEEFPPDCVGRVVNGHSLQSLDALLAGCISTFICQDHVLDAECRALLKDSSRKVSETFGGVSDASRRYFERLHEIARLVLAELGETPD